MLRKGSRAEKNETDQSKCPSFTCASPPSNDAAGVPRDRLALDRDSSDLAEVARKEEPTTHEVRSLEKHAVSTASLEFTDLGDMYSRQELAFRQLVVRFGELGGGSCEGNGHSEECDRGGEERGAHSDWVLEKVA